MGRLIDIDRLCNDLAKRWSIADKKKENTIRAVMADVVTPIVVSQPIVDAVQVIRCRECKFGKWDIGDRGMYCGRRYVELGTHEDFFCAAAKSREATE